MRTISKGHKKRLIAQSSEADFRGLEKVAATLIHQANNNPVRDDLDEYVYSHQDLQQDVENLLWNAVIRTEDYYGKTADAREIGEMIEVLAEDLITSIRTKIGGDVIGPHEPFVPGEQRLIVEIDEDGR